VFEQKVSTLAHQIVGQAKPLYEELGVSVQCEYSSGGLAYVNNDMVFTS
jgi:hypothetical protein